MFNDLMGVFPFCSQSMGPPLAKADAVAKTPALNNYPLSFLLDIGDPGGPDLFRTGGFPEISPPDPGPPFCPDKIQPAYTVGFPVSFSHLQTADLANGFPECCQDRT